jgi:hypothetical protein
MELKAYWRLKNQMGKKFSSRNWGPELYDVGSPCRLDEQIFEEVRNRITRETYGRLEPLREDSRRAVVHSAEGIFGDEHEI